MKVFPVDINKIPLVPWRESGGSADPAQHAKWQEEFGSRLAYWGIATGIENDLLVLDVDNKNEPENNGWVTIQNENLVIPDTAFQRTRSGGAHFLFRYPKDGRHYGNRVKFKPGLDTRGEGGYIVLYGGIDWSKPIAEAPQWLTEAVSKSQPQKIDPANISPVGVAPNIAKEIINECLENVRHAPEGESNNVLNVESFRMGQLVASGSITREFAEQCLLDAALYRRKPLYESKATIASGLNGGIQKPLTSPFPNQEPVPEIKIEAPYIKPEEKVRWTPKHFTKADLLNSSKLKKPQLFQDWSTEDIHLTTADGGTGKTTLALLEAVCMALGQSFLGFSCLQPGAKTLFIIGEDEEAKIAAILGAMLRQMGIMNDDEKINKILESIVVKKDADLCLIAKDRSGFLHVNVDAMDKINQAIEDIQPKRIVFDPIASFWGSESALNDMNRVVSKFMGSIASRGICVEMINHMGKNSSSAKDMGQLAGRGGSGLPSHARVVRTLRSLDDEEFFEKTGEHLEEGQSAILCNVGKFSDNSPLLKRPFVIIRNGYLFTRKDLSEAKVREIEQDENDIVRVLNFIQEERGAGKYPTKAAIEAFFAMNKHPIGPTKLKHALAMLQHMGHEGVAIRFVPNPDALQSEKVAVLTDLSGKEL